MGDFTPFYITIAICSIILGSLLILNFVCCCSKYSEYWLDRHTGNRWIVSVWSSTPHKQPPLDFAELEHQFQYPYIPYISEEYQEVHHHSENLSSVSCQPLTSSQEYLELHKRESDIWNGFSNDISCCSHSFFICPHGYYINSAFRSPLVQAPAFCICRDRDMEWRCCLWAQSFICLIIFILCNPSILFFILLL